MDKISQDKSVLLFLLLQRIEQSNFRPVVISSKKIDPCKVT